MKKVSSLVLSLLLAIIPVSTVGAYSGYGVGSVGNPYVITTCAQLFEINSDLDAHYVLDADVSCSGATWSHIGTLTSSAFSGTLDGQGHAIYDLTVDDTNGVGLFTYINGGTIQNLRLIRFDITGTGTVGALAARADNATISRVHVSNSTVYSEYGTGGMIGIINDSVISDSSVTNTTVAARGGAGMGEYIGGFVGISDTSTYDRSWMSGTVDAMAGAPSIDSTGGFFGSSTADIVNDSYSNADVLGDMGVGGFAGRHASSTFTRSYASGDVTGNSNVGGFSGSSALSMVTDSFALGSVVANTMSGGLIGRVQAIGGDVTNSTWDITRTGQATCVGADQGISYPTTCLSGVNDASTEPSYFFNNTTSAPLDNWNFTDVWQVTSDLPVLRTAPQGPAEVRVATTATTLRVMWDPPLSDGGKSITSYELKYRKSGTETYTVVTSIPTGSAPEYTITSGLIPDTGYNVQVRAINALGASPWLSFITFTNANSVTSSLSVLSSLSTGTTVYDSVIQSVSDPLSSDSTTQDRTANTTQNTQTDDTEETKTDTSSNIAVVIVIVILVLAGIVIVAVRLFVRK